MVCWRNVLIQITAYMVHREQCTCNSWHTAIGTTILPMFAFRKRAPMSPQGNLVMHVWELGHCVWTKTTDNPVIVLSVVSNTPNISGRMLLHIVRHFAAYCGPFCWILWTMLLHIVGHVAAYCGPCCCILWTMLRHIVSHFLHILAIFFMLWAIFFILWPIFCILWAIVRVQLC